VRKWASFWLLVKMTSNHFFMQKWRTNKAGARTYVRLGAWSRLATKIFKKNCKKKKKKS